MVAPMLVVCLVCGRRRWTKRPELPHRCDACGAVGQMSSLYTPPVAESRRRG